jgi:hypothetical protein
MTTRSPRSDVVTATLRILPEPDRPYAALKADLVRLGWRWASESQAPPLLPGEPERVQYTHPAGGTLCYAYNPAIGLREIEVGAGPEQIAELERLPQLTANGVATLLASETIAELLRGLFAARALQLAVARRRIDALRTHPDELIRRAAEDVLRTLPVATG